MLYFDYNEYIKEGIYFMLIQDDALRSVIVRTREFDTPFHN